MDRHCRARNGSGWWKFRRCNRLSGNPRATMLGIAVLAIGGCDPGARESPDPVADFAWAEATIEELQIAMATGRATSRSLTEDYLRRIEALDRSGPELRSMLDLNPDALGIADELDEERRAGRLRGPLHGIPIVVKDNIDTADGMTTTAGSLALEGSIASRDAHVVERLRAAGAVILGKANLSEWANFRSTNSSSGWSGRGGQVKNPYILDRSPCGSSSGTAVAVAANLTVAGVGTETDGSIVCPAAVNGLVGIKPTVGLVSRSGIIPIAHSQDTAGPMARTVADAAILLGALAGEDARDPSTTGSAGRFPSDPTSLLDPDALRGARIGIARARVTGYSPPADFLFEQAIGTMREAGAVIVDPADIPYLGEYGAAEWTILLFEFRTGINQYLAGLPGDPPVRSLAELIEFNEANRDRAMPHFGQEILMMAERTRGLEDPEYRMALETARYAAAGLDAVLAEHSLDAIIAPSGTPAWPIDLINGDHFRGSSSAAPAVAGYPHVTVPMGAVHGLPVGLSFIGSAWSEPTLIRLAHAFEQATRHRRPPRFESTVAY
jgi:amidase